MGNVLIIKNSDLVIHKYAEESYNLKESRIYNAGKDNSNQKYIAGIKKKLKNGIILILTYDKQMEDRITDAFIGLIVDVNEQDNIQYRMYRHLEKKDNAYVIESIIDKIDLDINQDFLPGCYVILSEMESLYDELYERIMPLMNSQSEEACTIESEEFKYELKEYAQKDEQAIRIYSTKKVGENRTEFQRDRERVVNCKAFRRMVDKAQIFSAEKGDYYRTRMTHTLEVNQIAKAIAIPLGLNVDLTEAIALGHDIGHTPFGHQGERTLDDILSGEIKTSIVMHEEMLKERCFGGFKHNYQSVRMLTQNEEKYVDHQGLDVSVQVVEGVLKHTRLKKCIELKDFLEQRYIDEMRIEYDEDENFAATLEGQTVAIADEIAQRGHDVDDALTSGVMTINDLIDTLKIGKCNELKKRIEDEIKSVDATHRLLVDKNELKTARIVSCIVNYMITDTIRNSKDNLTKYNGDVITMKNDKKYVAFSRKVEKVNSYLERVVQKKVICNNEVARADYNANMVIIKLFERYYTNPRLLHNGTLHKIFVEMLEHEDLCVSNSAVYLSDGSVDLVNKEIKILTTEAISNVSRDEYLNTRRISDENDRMIFEKRRILVRAIVDYIAGMTDGYALQEYEKLM